MILTAMWFASTNLDQFYHMPSESTTVIEPPQAGTPHEITVALQSAMRYDIGNKRQKQGEIIMLSAEVIQTMGRKDVSANADLTMERTKEVLKAAKRKQKDEIDALTGLKRVSINRVYATGVITAKVAVAIGQVLNLNPLYLTGDVDEQGVCTDDILISFLTTKGYAKVAQGLAVQKPRGDAENKTDAPGVSKEQGNDSPKTGTKAMFSSDFSNSPELAKAADELSLEDAHHLLTSLYIKARAGGDAAKLLDFIKRSLMM